jgi:hypothetical protein
MVSLLSIVIADWFCGTGLCGGWISGDLFAGTGSFGRVGGG